jgi:AcrR family transcriptional regulator
MSPGRSARKSAAVADEANGANRRDALLRVAARLFREKGFDGTTVRDIADAAGMRSGSPFYHFANKHELLAAVMEQGLRQGLERIEQVEAANRALPLRERFLHLVRTHAGILHDQGSDFIPVMLYEWRSLPPDYRRRLIALKDRYDAIWQRTLDELHEAGLLGAEPKIARLLILGAINFTATWYKKPRGAGGARVGLDALAEQAAALFLHAPQERRP